MDDFVVVPMRGSQLPGSFEVVVRVRAEHTSGVMAVLEETLVPKAFVTPHVHQNDVSIYVLSGSIGVLVGEEVTTAERGDWVLKPRNVPHAMWNAGLKPARIIEVLTPGGTERWFEESCERHGIEFFDDSPWIPELRRRFDIG
jgi:quercetin dioxygenase-like cupin family protein